jgi:uncharacterized RDD family membrane protein YckC
VTKEKLHDRRGALALAIVGFLGLAGSSIYAFTEMTSYTMVEGTIPMGLSFALLVAALMRFWRGRPLKDGAALTRYHQKIGSHMVYNILRFVGLAIDVALCAALALVIVLFLDEVLPGTAGVRYDWALDHKNAHLAGVDFWDTAVLTMLWSLCGILILGPAATWGATPGMMAMGFRWVRAKDGGRVGALHAFLRFLAMPLCIGFQVVIMFVGTVFGARKMRDLRTGRVFMDRSGRRATWKARRTFADLVTRTETFRPSVYAGLDSPPAPDEGVQTS